MILQVIEGTKTVAEVASRSDNPIVALLTGLLLMALGALVVLFYRYDGLNKETRENRLKDQEIAMTMNNLLDQSIEAGTRNSDNIIKAIEASERVVVHKLELYQKTRP